MYDWALELLMYAYMYVCIATPLYFGSVSKHAQPSGEVYLLRAKELYQSDY